MNKNKIGKNINLLLQENNLLQKQLALDLKIKTNTLSTYVSGTAIPRIDTLIKIADYFDVSLDFITGRTSIRNLNDKQLNSKDNLNQYLIISSMKRDKSFKLLIHELNKIINDTPCKE